MTIGRCGLLIIMLTLCQYGLRLHANEPLEEKNVIIINDEAFNKADILKGVSDCGTYDSGV